MAYPLPGGLQPQGVEANDPFNTTTYSTYDKIPSAIFEDASSQLASKHHERNTLYVTLTHAHGACDAVGESIVSRTEAA
jgi:hypothetical protein